MYLHELLEELENGHILSRESWERFGWFLKKDPLCDDLVILTRYQGKKTIGVLDLSDLKANDWYKVGKKKD